MGILLTHSPPAFPFWVAFYLTNRIEQHLASRWWGGQSTGDTERRSALYPWLFIPLRNAVRGIKSASPSYLCPQRLSHHERPWGLLPTFVTIKPILKEINPECSLEGLMLKLKLQYFGHLMRRAESLEKTLILGKLKAGGEGDDRR